MDGGVMRRLPGGRASRAGLDPSRLGASEGAELVNSENAATYYLTQAGHHRTGIEAAVGYVDAGFARSRPEQTDDIVSSEFSSIERDWGLICVNTTSGWPAPGLDDTRLS
jgi:hypothetical protein